MPAMVNRRDALGSLAVLVELVASGRIAEAQTQSNEAWACISAPFVRDIAAHRAVGRYCETRTARWGTTALRHAVIYGYPSILKVLIGRGADVNRKDQDGKTALSAVEESPSLARKRRRVIKMLEQAGGVQ